MTTPKPLAERITEALLAYEEKVERKGWDQPATLRPLKTDQYGRVKFGVNVLPDIWQCDPRPYLGMDSLAHGYNTGLIPGEPPANWIGWVFIFECWMLGTSKEVTEEEIVAVGEHRLIHQHPMREEARQVKARSFDGNTYDVIRVRGQAPRTDCLDDPEGLANQCLARLVDATRTAGQVM